MELWRRRDDPDLTDFDRSFIDEGLAVYTEELYVGGVIQFQLNDKQVHGARLRASASHRQDELPHS